MFLLLLFAITSQARTIIVPTDAATLVAAASQAKPGDTIQIRSGTYTTQQVVNNLAGTSDNPILIQGYPGDARPIFDGTTAGVKAYDSLLTFRNCSYVTVEGFEVRNSDSGIHIYNSYYFILRNHILHEFQNWCATASGSYITVRDNRCSRGVLANIAKSNSSGWTQCISAEALEGQTGLSSDLLFENNTVYNCYGEGIDATVSERVTIRYNTVYDTFSVNIYADNVRNIIIDSNIIYSTNPEYYRNGAPASAFLLGTESWAKPQVVADNITYINNLVFNSGHAFGYYRETNYYTNVRLYHNTWWNTTGVWIDPFPTNYTSTGNEIRNNIIYIPNSGSFGIGSNVENWKISSNVWLHVDNIPSDAQKANDASAPKSYFYSDPVAANLFSTTGAPPNTNGAPIPTWFKPGTNSILRGGGATISNQFVVTPIDFFGVKRKTVPDIGFAEYT